MSLTVANTTNAPIEYKDVAGDVKVINANGSASVEAITASLYAHIVGQRAVVSAVTSDNEALAQVLNLWQRQNALNAAYPVTCTAGAAILSAAQVSQLDAPAIRTVGISAAGAVAVGTATTTPILPDGVDGQVIRLLNVGAQTITITDQGTMAASNLRLTAATVAIAARNSVELTFNATIGDWVQTGALVAVI